MSSRLNRFTIQVSTKKSWQVTKPVRINRIRKYQGLKPGYYDLLLYLASFFRAITAITAINPKTTTSTTGNCKPSPLP